uniref:HTH La-type RNA-binding domain-containing protein n=1 Tax=Mycena chlorophos TaxID=658473 RepID=A0ABQ0LVR7_MYCCL|nr:predicted protein [Mycena chlorophos]
MATVNVWVERAAKARQGSVLLPSQPPPPPVDNTFVVRRPVDAWPTVATANANGHVQPPKSKKSSPSPSPSTFSSTLPTPAFSSPANSGAVSPSEPARASGSGSVSSAGDPPAPSGKTKQRKWVPIPPEELRAAAQQQQRPRNGFIDRSGRSAGRKSESRSGTASRAASVSSRSEPPQPPPPPPPATESQPEYASHNAWQYQAPQSAYPVQERYFPQQYQYWSANPPIHGELPHDESKDSLPPHNHYRDGWRPMYWWMHAPAPVPPPSTDPPPPSAVEPRHQARPPKPTSGTSSLPTGRVILFGTVDAESIAMDSLTTKTESKRRKPQPQPQQPQDDGTSPSSRTRESGWRTTEAVWPVEPPSTTSPVLPAGLPLSASKPALFSIGVSPQARAQRLAEHPGVEVVDLTVALAPHAMNGQEPGSALGGQWEFGTTKFGDEVAPSPSPTQPNPPPAQFGQYGYPWGYQYDMGMYGYPPPHAPAHPMAGPAPLAMMPPPHMMVPYDMDSTTSPSVSPTAERSVGSEWEVRDFGYGFGNGNANAGASGNADLVRASVLRQPRDFDQPTIEDRPPPRRAPPWFEPRGGRRGRGGFRPGYRGRAGPPGVYGPPMPTPRSQHHHHHPPYDESYYVPPPPPQTIQYYAQPPPPPPNLRTQLSFPIDRLRMEILSQLEFYLSPDNLATDLYLRQQMDSRGWIRIDTLASFNRVMAKTTDLNLVRDVLALSHYVEIRGDWVRSTEGWEKYVLPTAAPSVVEPEAEKPEEPESSSLLMQSVAGEGAAGVGPTAEEEEDEEEDVVFVIDRAAPAWSPARPR